MHLQLAQPFPATSEAVFQEELTRVQFKNYLPLRRGLVENMTLNIMVRETNYPLSDNVITSFMQNALHKEIVLREYHQEVAGGGNDPKLPYYDMRAVVEGKWQQEDAQRDERHALLLEEEGERPLLGRGGERRVKMHQEDKKELIEQRMASELASQLSYHPEITVYVRRGIARLLLKVNLQAMYKHGWKRRVGWAPVRESIAAAVMTQTGLLNTTDSIKLWDPFCGSATLPIVAAAMHNQAGVRSDVKANFNWPHWPIFKPEYLD